MNIRDILRPKTKKEINQALAEALAETPTMVEFIIDHEIFQYHRSLKAWHYIADLVKTPPDELYVIYANNKLFKMIKPKLDSYDSLNQPIKNIKFMGGPFSHSLVKKNSRVAELYGGTMTAIMVSLDHLIEMIN